jgi:Flp pilus assembly protein TadG
MFRRKDIRGESGQALVEFALVAPLLLVLVFAVVQFGLLYNNYLQVTDAARTAARQAAIAHTSTAGITAARASAGGLDQTKFNVQVDPASSTWDSGTDVTATATYPYQIDILGIVVKSGQLSSKTTERVE